MVYRTMRAHHTTYSWNTGDTYGVDVSCILYVILSVTFINPNLNRDPVASVKDLTASWLDDWYRVHRFENLDIKFVFVFDGHELVLKTKSPTIYVRGILTLRKSSS